MNNNNKKIILNLIFYIYYFIKFQKNQSNFQALLNDKIKVHTINLKYIKKLGFYI